MVAELVDLSADRQARWNCVLIIVYAISSLESNYIYVGMTKNLGDRLKRHNKGWEKTTRLYAPYRLVYKESCTDRDEARKREKYWKSGVGKEQLRKLRDKLI